MVDGHHSELDGARGPHVHRKETALLLRRTCIRGVAMWEDPVRAGDAVVESQGRAWAAVHWNVTSGLGCCSGRDAAMCQEVLGRHLKLVADGYWSVVLERDGCVMFVRGWRVRLPVAATVWDYYGDQ